MAKICSICGKKLGLLSGRMWVADGLVCQSCWTSAGLDLSDETIKAAQSQTVNQIRDLIDIQLIKGQLGNIELDEEPEYAGTKKPVKKSQANRSNSVPNISGMPIDIKISAYKNHRISFTCEGEPVINFDDLINRREMIIGDVFVNNESGVDLPEIRIICESQPAIVEPCIICYESGRFKAGVNDRFETNDPPIDITEYAKVKRTRHGKVKFTMFLGEQQLQSKECPIIIKPAPAKEMEKLMHYIAYKQEKTASGPVNIFLHARDTGKFELDLMRQPELLYSMYSNDQEQLIGDVYVSNEARAMLKDVQFEARFTSDILTPMNVHLGDVPPCEQVIFPVDDPSIDVDKLAMLTDIETCIGTYRLYVNKHLVAETTGKITICPYNQWNADLILLPAYMTPNHPHIINVLQNASRWMLVNGMDPSLEGYQSEPGRVEEMVSAVYNALKELNIIYSNPPKSFFGPQRIRLCESVFEHKFATCMDMTILFASCLESFGLHPVLITIPGHIFAGVWLRSGSHLKEPVVSDAKLIQKYIDDGKLVAVECTAMNVGQNETYEDAKKIAYENIKLMVKHDVQQHECIDVQIARAMGVRPLPMRVTKDANTVVPVKPMPTDFKPVVKPEPKVVVEEFPKVVAQEEPRVSPAAPATKITSKGSSAYITEDYIAFTEDLSYISIDNFYDKQTKRVIKDAIAGIVAVEGPISQPALIRTLINTTSLGRASKQITEHLDKLVAAADVKITRQSGVRFLWNHGTDPAEYMKFRMREQRNPEDVCKYELKNAVCYLIQENGPMTKAEITKAMVGMFGYGRSSKKLEDGANAAIKAARELKAIEQDEAKRFVLV